MGERRVLTVPFPMKGLNRRWAYGQQQPDTAYDLLNVRPDESAEARTRGGTRPGLIKAYPNLIGVGEVRLLSQVRAVPTQGSGFWSTNFDEYTSGGLYQHPLWSAPSGTTLDEPQYLLTSSSLVVDLLHELDPQGNPTPFGSVAVRAVIPDIDLTKAYQIRAQMVPLNTSPPGKLSLYAGLDNTSPNQLQDVISCTLNWSDLLTTATASVANIIAGVANDVDTAVLTDLAPGTAHDLVLDIDPVGGTATFKFDGTQVAQITGVSFPLPGGGRFGFQLKSNNTDQQRAAYSRMVIAFQSTVTAQANRNYLIAGANGLLKRENTDGDELEPAAASSLADIVKTPPAPQQTIQAVDYLGRLYIADHDEPSSSGTDGVISGSTFSSAGNPSMGGNMDINNDVLVITAPKTSANLGTYKASAASGGNITLDTAPSSNQSSLTFRVERAAKVYDPILDTLSIWYNNTTPIDVTNQPPTGCIVIGTYMDRVVAAGGKNNPQVWFMSKRGDPDDFDFSKTNEGAAVAGDDSNAGQIGAPITAMIPSIEDYLLFGSLGSKWIMRGDPTVGGRMDNLSRRIGCVGTEAWCYGPNSSVWFLSRDGLYTIAPGATSYPQSVSEEVLPLELKNIDNTITHVTLEYDVQLRGIYIHLTTIESGNALHYWFDMELPGFWPFEFGRVGHAPFTTLQYEADNATSAAMLLGARDGFLRRYSPLSIVDDATNAEPIVSFMVLGPIPLGSTPDREGMIQRIELILGRLSNPVTWKIYVGNTAEDAIRKMREGAMPQKTGTTRKSSVNGDHSLLSVHHPRCRDYYAVIRLENVNNDSWWFEQFVAIIRDVGKHRSKTV